MKNFKRTLTLALSTLTCFSVMALSACGDEPAPTPNPEQNVDYTAYTKQQWDALDFTGKEIAYQFMGEWEFAEFSMNFAFLLNFYSDGCVKVEQYHRYTEDTTYIYVGYWSEEVTVDGNEITFKNLYARDLDNYLISHDYDYVLFEESDGTYSFGYDFCLAPGQYYRTVDVVGGSDITYGNESAFYSAYKLEQNTPEPDPDPDPEPDTDIEKEVSYTFEQNTGVIIADAEKATAGALIELYTDGTANAKVGFAMNGMFMFQYGVYGEEEGTWSLDGETLTIVLNGVTHTVSVGEGSSFTWSCTYINSEGAAETAIATVVLK